MEEIWKDIPGYEGLYKVSNLGKIKSLSRFRKGNNGARVPVKEIILKQAVNKLGYAVVSLSKNGKRPQFRVHRLVAFAFLDNPRELPQINHIDGDKLNNKLSNLEWVTPKENTKHAKSIGARDYAFGENSHYAKLTEKDVERILRLVADGLSIAEVAFEYNVHNSSIERIKNNRTWQHIDRSEYH